MRHISRWLGIEPNPLSLKEKAVSSLGALVGIGVTALISVQLFPLHDAMLVVGSMGASAVLLFAVPHGQLSQPWPAAVGQLVSALVGVACAMSVPNEVLAAALAVSLAVLAMHLTRSMHPPGGATSLIAVIGGPAIHALGFTYVLLPVALNALSILLVALLFNNLFGWRRYPAALARREAGELSMPDAGLSRADIEYAIRQEDSTIDVTEEELLRIYVQAIRHREAGNKIDR